MGTVIKKTNSSIEYSVTHVLKQVNATLNLVVSLQDKRQRKDERKYYRDALIKTYFVPNRYLKSRWKIVRWIGKTLYGETTSRPTKKLLKKLIEERYSNNRRSLYYYEWRHYHNTTRAERIFGDQYLKLKKLKELCENAPKNPFETIRLTAEDSWAIEWNA